MDDKDSGIKRQLIEENILLPKDDLLNTTKRLKLNVQEQEQQNKNNISHDYPKISDKNSLSELSNIDGTCNNIFIFVNKNKRNKNMEKIGKRKNVK